jgi:hypothetical protein
MMILDVVAMVAITATDVVMGAELSTATATPTWFTRSPVHDENAKVSIAKPDVDPN